MNFMKLSHIPENVWRWLMAILLLILSVWTLSIVPESDFTQNYVAARAWLNGLDPNGNIPELIPLCCADQQLLTTSLPQTAHPPLTTMFVLPWAALPWALSRWLWMLFGYVLIVWTWNKLKIPPYMQLLTMSFVLMGLSLGAFEPLLFACIGFCLWYLDKMPVRAGMALGFAIAIKTYPIVLFAGLLLTKRWRTAGATVVSAGILTVIAELVLGIGVTRDWLAFVPVNAELQADLPWNLSLVRIVRVIFPGFPPTIAFMLLCAFFIAFMIPTLLRNRDLSVLIPVMLLCSPISWPNYFLMFALVRLPWFLTILIAISSVFLYAVWVYIIPGDNLAVVAYPPLLISGLVLWYLSVRIGLNKTSLRAAHG